MKDLLDWNDSFEQLYPNEADQTAANFVVWAAARQTPPPAPEPIPYTYYSAEVPVLQTAIAHFVTKAYRYCRVYIKKALDTAPLLTFDDFISLADLAAHGSMTKTDLIESSVNEITSGMLVIKRLIDRGFVSQSNDEQDKRSRRISITDAGMAVLQSVQPAMNQATDLFRGDLSDAEQQQLIALLIRLDQFHKPLFLEHKEASLEELSEKVAKP